MTSHKMTACSAMLAAVLAGCVAGDPGGTAVVAAKGAVASPPSCPASACVSITNVVLGLPGSPNTGKIDIYPQPVGIGSQPGTVGWTIVPPTRTFFVPANGIEFKSSAIPAGPIASAVGGTAGVSDNYYEWTFTTSAPKSEWPYNLNLVTKGSPPSRWICDPTIVNTDLGFTPAIATPVTVPCTKLP